MGQLASYAGRGRWSEPGEAIRECRGRSLRRGDGGPAGLARAPGPDGGEELVDAVALEVDRGEAAAEGRVALGRREARAGIEPLLAVAVPDADARGGADGGGEAELDDLDASR